MFDQVRSTRGRRVKRELRPSLSGLGAALDRRLLPGNMLFYSDTNYSYGTMYAQAGAIVPPVDQTLPSGATDSGSGTTSASAQASISNVVIGSPGYYGSGGYEPPVDNASASEQGSVGAFFSEPGPDPSDSNSMSLELGVGHYSIDTAKSDDGGSYTVDGNAIGIMESTSFSTGNSYNFNIQDPSGGPPNGTITVGFTIYLKDAPPEFTQDAYLSLQSSHLDASLIGGDLEITDPSEIDPSTGKPTVLDSVANFDFGGYVTIQHTVPAFTHESISANSEYGTGVNSVDVSRDHDAVYDGEFYYNLTETID